MNYSIAYESHPNNELRATLYKKRGSFFGKNFYEQSEGQCTDVSRSEGSNSSDNVVGTKSPLDLRSEFKTVCKAHLHKRTKFGMDARRSIMRASGAMDRLHPNPEDYLFITATLPGDDEWCKWAIAEDAHNIVNGLKAWLSKRVSNRMEFYVWEHQKRAALHLHYCVYMPDLEDAFWVVMNFRDEWIRLLEGVHKRTGVNPWGRYSEHTPTAKYAILQTQVQVVEHSVAKYMAGYCGGVKDKHSEDRNKDYYPKRWWGISRPLNALTKSMTLKQTHDFEKLEDARREFEDVASEWSIDAIAAKDYPHKYGHGKTSVSYHDPKTQTNLWLSKMTTRPNWGQHPSACLLIVKARLAMSALLGLSRHSKRYSGGLSKFLLNDLLDSSHVGALSRYTLSTTHIRILDRALSEFHLSSLDTHQERSTWQRLKDWHQAYSQVRELLRFDSFGWLDVDNDLPATVDSLPKIGDVGTNDSNVGTQQVDGYSGLVPSEPTCAPISEQLSCLYSERQQQQ